jgi:predicted GIY-YIG superfamily endonuclease/antitoxin component of RelBE/YafQ-DinJ toxin-antitoxin module
MYYVYALKDGDEVGYVGISQNVEARVQNHMATAKRANTGVTKWLRERLERDSQWTPEVEILEELETKDLDREAHHIQALTTAGSNLANVQHGDGNRDTTVSIRVSTEMAEQIRAEAKSLGVKMSDVIRWRVFDEEPDAPVPTSPTYQSLKSEVSTLRSAVSSIPGGTDALVAAEQASSLINKEDE